ncbi:hypothetical protein [Caballeronia sordidicola]|uniref:Mobilization protein n=1 Tax=Caballeronia sordidicola TaxID=196367 RepID=A0A242M528_CABSO|nr:hypothetical protein [Caballeronia sordidicola]OTP66202.1 hypothetical protein PAMC26510_35880 [Caballeronia sordidicola]OXC78776.1 hypothetical protein BSU04_10150 [Caballeronia sordidicola]
MTLLKSRLAATDSKLKEIKDARRASDKVRRQQYRQTTAVQERKVVLVGECVMRRLDRGEWDEAGFRQMKDELSSRPVDRALFDLD